MAAVGLQPADIILVVDNSGSMSLEAQQVQANINAFSSQIFLANIDARVVLISAYPSDSQGICVPQPLGSGGCPAVDTNPPNFLHVDASVGSSDALTQILDRYPDYAGTLRQTASTHVIVVSDDDSAMAAPDFTAAFTALHPSFSDFRFHAVVGTQDPDPLGCLATPNSCCFIAADLGTVYIALTQVTGGVLGNLCDQEFQPLFDALAMQVISEATIACEYEIPAPPEGEDFDKDRVNVEFDDGSGSTLEIGRVDSQSDCAGVSDGWYYDDPNMPSTIVVCPQTCERIQGFESASVAVKFGCETVPAA